MLCLKGSFGSRPAYSDASVATVATAASSLGLGAVVFEVGGTGRVVSVALSSVDSLESSTFRELGLFFLLWRLSLRILHDRL